MIGFILFIALCVACYKTNPDEKSFKKYLENIRKAQTNTTNSKLLNKMSNIISQAVAPLPKFTIQNYGVLSLSTIEDGTTFIGILNSWYPINLQSGNKSSGSGSSGSYRPVDQEVEKRIEEFVAKGHKEKANRNFNGAAKYYIKAAQSYERNYDNYEAGNNYENAYKMYQALEENDMAYDNAKKAAKLFATHERTLPKAARLYDSMAQISKKQGNLKVAFENYAYSIKLYDRMGGNNNGFQSRMAQGDIAAEIGGGSYSEKAITIYENLAKSIVSNSLLLYNVKALLTKASFLVLDNNLSKKNIGNFYQTIESYAQNYPLFADSSEYKIFSDIGLALSYKDSEKIADICKKYKTTYPLTKWQINILDRLNNATINDYSIL